MADTTQRKVKQILTVLFFINLAVSITKLLIGLSIKSSSLVADGFHSLTDASSNIIAFIGIHFASKPKDIDHPYGHQKFETLANLFIAVGLFFLSFQIIFSAIHKIFKPIPPEVRISSMIFLVSTLIINIVVSIYEYRKGKQYDSQLLISDSLHTRSDIYISTGVIISLGLIHLGAPIFIDSISSMIVSLFIIKAGFDIFKTTSDVLLDKAVVSSDEIKMLVEKIEQVQDVHKVRSRGTATELYIDMHVMVPEELSIRDAHEISHAIERLIAKHYQKDAHVTVHIEPHSSSV